MSEQCWHCENDGSDCPMCGQRSEYLRLKAENDELRKQLANSISLENHQECCDEHARQVANCNMDHHAEAERLRDLLQQACEHCALGEPRQRDPVFGYWYHDDPTCDGPLPCTLVTPPYRHVRS